MKLRELLRRYDMKKNGLKIKTGQVVRIGSKYFVFVGVYLNSRLVFLKVVDRKPKDLIYDRILINGREFYVIPEIVTFIRIPKDRFRILNQKIARWEIECLLPGIFQFFTKD